jgi:all-trans-nonaprenyl-diphosphate synthase
MRKTLSSGTMTSLFAPVEADLELLTASLKQLIGARHPILYAAAEYLFTTTGKRVRPAIVLLIARLLNPTGEISPRHRRLAEITEMIHNASLVHDDVVDESNLRRGIPTVNQSFTNRVAVLAGDFLFAQSSWYLAHLDNLQVVKLLSEVIMDLAEGEIRQGLNSFDAELSLEDYLQKSYYKTASLIANSAKASAVLSEVSPEIQECFYEYGKHLGLAFQIVDDILDFTGSEEVLGKPAGSDLSNGHLTAPAIYALEEYPGLAALMEREFSQEGDLDQALTWVRHSKGIERARELALYHAQYSADSLAGLDGSPAKDCLLNLTDYVVCRLH